MSQSLSMKQTFDRHRSIIFDKPSQSAAGALFSDKRCFQKFQNLLDCLQTVPFQGRSQTLDQDEASFERQGREPLGRGGGVREHAPQEKFEI